MQRFPSLRQASDEQRFRLILGVYILIGLPALVLWLFPHDFLIQPWTAGDLGWPLVAVREIAAGLDPFNRPFNTKLVPYPMYVVVLIAPLSPLPDLTAAGAWTILGMFGCQLLARQLLPNASKPLRYSFLLFAPFWMAWYVVQWSPMLLSIVALSLWLHHQRRPIGAGIVVPLLAAKPQVGLSLACGLVAYYALQRAWRTFEGMAIGAVAWSALTFLLYPGWVQRFLASIGDYERYYPALALPWVGLPLVILLIYQSYATWRRNDALLVLACLTLAALFVLPQRADYDNTIAWVPLVALLVSRHARLGWLCVGLAAVALGLYLADVLSGASSAALTLYPIAAAVIWLAHTASTARRKSVHPEGTRFRSA
jgi:hypothetical protein